MKYAVLNSLLGACAIALGFFLGGWHLLICWPGLNFLLLGIAYASQSPGIFGKRLDGSLPWWSWALFLPLHLLTLLCWHLLRLGSREPAFSQVNDRLIVGRRLLGSELPGGALTVLDLTAEFAEPLGILRRADYRSFPILDAAIPHSSHLLELLASLPDDKLLYIHCAQGHGRTGLVAAAWLVFRQEAADATAALAILRAVRPGIGLNGVQRKLLQEVFEAVP